jgi:tetratricopeptide (TPR) repeat protein
LSQGLAVAKGTPGGNDLARQLQSQLRLAARARAAQDLHAAADRMRFLFDPESLSRQELRALESHCHTAWDARALITDRSESELTPEVERQIRTDLLEMAVLWADFRVRCASGEAVGKARRQALEVLAEAEALLGPSPLLDREREAYEEALGKHDSVRAAAFSSADLPPRTPWEHYALGRYLLRAGKYELAARELDRAIDLEPQHFWPNFCRGVCAYRLRRFTDAVTAFTACIALAPGSAPCYHNRALAEESLGHTERALNDYDLALRHDPALAAAVLNRGLLHLRGQRYDQAAADLQRALDCGADPATVHYNLSLVYLARQDRKASLASLRQALQHDPGHRDARALQNRLLRGR